MDMKKLLLLSILACVTLSSSAQLLWKVSGNGLEKPSYLLGTMHLAPAAMIDWIPGMDEALENCEVVIGEKDYDDKTPSPLSFYKGEQGSGFCVVFCLLSFHLTFVVLLCM